MTAHPHAAELGETHRATTTTRVRRQTLGAVIRSEGIKLRTLRSTWIGIVAVLVLLIGFGAIAAVFSGDPSGPGRGEDRGPLSTVLTGANFAVLLIGILGALAGAREYASGMISATLAAVPRRWPVVLGKAVALVAVIVPTAGLGVLGAFIVGMPILSADGQPTVGLTDDGVLKSLIGMAGYVTAIALIGLGLGVLLRSTAGSIGALVAGVVVIPNLAGALLPDSFDVVLQLLPSSAAAAFTTVEAAGDQVLGAAAGTAVLVTWVAGVLLAAVVAMLRRDV